MVDNLQKAHSWKQILFLGISLGIISFLCWDFALFLPVLFSLYSYVYIHYSSPDERKFILSIITIGLGLRILGIVLYYYTFLSSGHMDVLAPDGEGYQARGWYISRFLSGKSLNVVPSAEQIFNDYSFMVSYYNAEMPSWKLYQVGIFSYFISFMYALFGYVPLLIKFLNSLWSVLVALLTYTIASDLFGKRVGKIAMIIVMFLPSIFIFSLTSTRDTAIIFFLMLFIYTLNKYQLHNSFVGFLTLILSLGTIYFIRAVIFVPLVAVIVVFFFLRAQLRLRSKVVSVCIIVTVMFSLNSGKKIISYFDLATVTNPHIGYINTPGNNYKIFSDEYYSREKDIRQIKPLEFSIALAKGMVHYLFEPFPFKAKSAGELLGSVQAFFLIISFPFVVYGSILGLRYNYQQCQVFFIYLFIFSIMMAIGEGNVGTVFRHRDMVMPFFIIFVAAGISNFLGRVKLSMPA